MSKSALNIAVSLAVFYLDCWPPEACRHSRIRLFMAPDTLPLLPEVKGWFPWIKFASVIRRGGSWIPSRCCDSSGNYAVAWDRSAANQAGSIYSSFVNIREWTRWEICAGSVNAMMKLPSQYQLLPMKRGFRCLPGILQRAYGTEIFETRGKKIGTAQHRVNSLVDSTYPVHSGRCGAVPLWLSGRGG